MDRRVETKRAIPMKIASGCTGNGTTDENLMRLTLGANYRKLPSGFAVGGFFAFLHKTPKMTVLCASPPVLRLICDFGGIKSKKY